MKTFIISFLLIISLGVAAQSPTTTQYLGAPKTLIHNRGSFRVDSNLIIPRVDTLTAPYMAGELRYRTADSTVYAGVRLTGLRKWYPMGGGLSTNIYNSDGTLTGNRVLNGRELYSLTFDSLTAFNVNGPSLIKNTAFDILTSQYELDAVNNKNHLWAYGGSSDGSIGLEYLNGSWNTLLYSQGDGAGLSSNYFRIDKDSIVFNKSIAGAATFLDIRFKKLPNKTPVSTDSTLIIAADGRAYIAPYVAGGGTSAPAMQTLTDGATVTWDYATSSEAKVTIAGNRTLSITNLPADGKTYYGTLEVIQDATGSRTITLPTGSKVIGGGAGAVTLTTTGSATDILSFRYNGTTLFWTIGKNYN